MKRLLVVIFILIPSVILLAPLLARAQSTPVRVVKPDLGISVRCNGGTDQTFSMSSRTSVFSGEIIKYIGGQFFVLEVSLASEKWVAKDPSRLDDKKVILALAELKPLQILYQSYKVQLVFPPVTQDYIVPGPEVTIEVFARFIPENHLVLTKVGCTGPAVTSKK